MFGWFMIVSLSLHVIFNLIFIFRHFIKILNRYFLYSYNIVKQFYDLKISKYFAKKEDKNQLESEQENASEETKR